MKHLIISNIAIPLDYCSPIRSAYRAFGNRYTVRAEYDILARPYNGMGVKDISVTGLLTYKLIVEKGKSFIFDGNKKVPFNLRKAYNIVR